MFSDPLADMLTRIRNAGQAKHKSVDIPGSRTKVALADVMKQEGYIRNYKFIKDNKQGVLRIFLKYDAEEKHVIDGLERVSSPSRRVYAGSDEIKPVLNGLGVSVLSTSKGLMTDGQAKKQNIGGEVLCNIW
ncbi:MAG: 30S ribosomal protein S8 [Desulfobacteraceae bacterium]|nr:30S ribosomal protein S8 [Desulfobacteraceae bacterium]MCF8093877.1 30S ribosomal protein S8 [Desulfobacteraceae bacterium]